MAYDQGSTYEPPRRAYYGQPQQQAPVQRQYRQPPPQQYNDGYDQGYDQGYGQQQYGGYDGYGQDTNGGYDQGYANGGMQNGYGHEQHYDQGYQQRHPQDYGYQDHRQAPNGRGMNGSHQQRQANGYAQQERQYDPRYQQRPGRGGFGPQQNGGRGPQWHDQGHQGYQAAPQRRDPRQDYPAEQQSYHDQDQYMQGQATRGGYSGMSNGRPRPEQQPVQSPAQIRAQPVAQTQWKEPSPPAAKQDPKKSAMEEWKAKEKARMHDEMSKPKTVAQDNAFPTFPAKKKEGRSGGQSAMSGRISEEQGRPSTSGSGRPPRDQRPDMSRDNSYRNESPPQQQQLQRPSMDHQPYSFEPIQDRPPQGAQYQQDRHEHEPSVHDQYAGGGPQRPVAAQQAQDNRTYAQAPQANGHGNTYGYGDSRPARDQLRVQPIDTRQRDPRSQSAMNQHPMSPRDVVDQAPVVQRRPLPTQPPQAEPYSAISQYSQPTPDAVSYHDQHAQHNGSLAPGMTPQQHQRRSSLGDLYDGYYGEEVPAAVPASAMPQSREEEIESEMPDFDSAAPNQTSNLHKRTQTVDKHLNESPASAPRPLPAFPAQHDNGSVRSLPVQSQPMYGTQQPPAAMSHHDLGQLEQKQDPGLNGFVFGIPGEQVPPPQMQRQNQYHDSRQPMPRQPPMGYQQGRPGDPYNRPSMEERRPMQMPLRGGPPPGHPQAQRFHPNGRGPLPPQHRPDYGRQQTSQTVWSDPGQQRSDSAPPLRDGLPTPMGHRAQIGSPLSQQRSAPEPPQQQRHSNPDALPSHPVPVRPGLMDNGGSPPASRPAPVRQYDNQAKTHRREPSVVPDQPVTAEELRQLHAAVEANPASNKTALLYAKKLVEASSVLASEGGRLDPKTTARNREKYIMDGYKRVKKLVAAGYPEAQFYLADAYGQGAMGLEIDTKEAFTLYQAAAKAGHASAAYRTAVCCEMGPEEGGGTRRDYAKAVQWYRRAAALGDIAAMFKLGMILLKGLLGNQRNVGEAHQWLKRAAAGATKDNPHALHELGLLHESGNTNPEVRNKVLADDKYALELFQQAAGMGFKQSQFRLGQAYEYGTLGLPIDNRASISWYSKAAAQGEHQAELALSGWYLTGAEGILEHNETEAYLWARKAAQAEPPLGKALFAMGYFNENGIGCPKNVEEARRWYGRAAGKSSLHCVGQGACGRVC